MHNSQKISLTNSEWEIMRIIWTKNPSPVTSKFIFSIIHEKTHWSQSTVKTLLKKLVDKLILNVDKSKKVFYYTSNITEEKAMNYTISETFNHLCNMNKGKALINLISSVPLSENDIHKLQEQLTQKLKNAPKKVQCNCIAPEKSLQKP